VAASCAPISKASTQSLSIHVNWLCEVNR